MLRSVKELLGYSLGATDGSIGSCDDILFDDQDWRVRYMVADTGRWLSGKLVLLPRTVLGSPSWEDEIFPVNLDQEAIRESPLIEEDAPVSRQRDDVLQANHGHKFHWPEPGGPNMVPEPPAGAEESGTSRGDAHLRSAKEVIGYVVQAEDHEGGRIADAIVDDETWTIEYVVVQTGGWLGDKKYLLRTKDLETVEWTGGQVTIDMPAEAIEQCPEYDPTKPVNREIAVKRLDFHGRPC